MFAHFQATVLFVHLSGLGIYEFVFIHENIIIDSEAALERIQALVVSHVAVLELVFYALFLCFEGLAICLRQPVFADQSARHLVLGLSDVPVLPLLVQVQDMQRVPQEVLLDLVVERRLRHEAGRLVHFDQPGLETVVEEDVHAYYLKAERILNILWLRRPVYVSHCVNPCEESLHANLFDIVPHFLAAFVSALSVLVDVLKDGSEAPLVAHVCSVFMLVLNEAVCLFVDGIVC